MLSILWDIGDGREELYVAPSVAKIPALPAPDQNADCAGREHVAFQKLDGHGLVRTVIDFGSVYVMNANGKTVATYRFTSPSGLS